MRHDTRLIIRGYWGTNTPARSFQLTGQAMLQDAAKRGDLVNLTQYRTDNRDLFIGAGLTSEIHTAPLGPTHKRVFPQAQNYRGAWQHAEGGDDSNLIEYARPFGGDVPGLGHVSNVAASYGPSDAGMRVLPNTAFTVRLIIHETPEAMGFNFASLAWGEEAQVPEEGEEPKPVAGSMWQFLITDNESVMMRFAPTWNHEDFQEFITLLGTPEPTEEQQAQLVTLKKSLYVDYNNVSIQGDKVGKGVFYELTFIPEEMGKVSIYQGDKFVAEVNDTSILSTRRAGVVWGRSRLQIARNGGHFFWQVGYPEFTNNATANYLYPKGRWTGDMQFTLLSSVEPGVTAINAQDLTFSSTHDLIRLTWTSTDPRRCAFLYGANAFVPAGQRNGSTTAALDTNNLLDPQNNPPILTVRSQHEGECRRAQFDISLRDVHGATFQGLGFNYDTGENHTADLYVDGVRVVRNGLIKTATMAELIGTTPNLPRLNIAGAGALADLTLCSAWALLEEYNLSEGELIGDGRWLGDLVKNGLRLVGIPTSFTSGIANGPRLPRAAIGETWTVISNSGTLADFLISNVKKYGNGRILWVDGEGNWRLDFRPRVLKTINGHPAAFTSVAALNDCDTYPGRLAMLMPIDRVRDTRDFYNCIPVIGAPGFDGDPVAGSWTDWASITGTTGPLPANFIGREKRMEPVTDTACRTIGDCERVGRSLGEHHFRPPDYITFETYYHGELFIGDLISCNGVYAYIDSAVDGDTGEDRQCISARVAGF